MRLKPNTMAEFTQTIEKRILPILRKQKGFRDEITFIAPGGTEAVGISLWDSREQAEAYNSSGYPEVLKELNKLVEATPNVKTYDVANSTAHNIAARPASLIVRRVGPLNRPSSTLGSSGFRLDLLGTNFFSDFRLQL